MSANKNDPKDAVKMTSGLDSQTQADLDALMRKYDRESNTRVWEGWQRWAVGAIMVIFSLYCIGMTLFYSGLPETRLAAFLAMIVFIGFLTYPVKKGHVKVNSMPWYDIILMLVGASCFLYFAFNALPIIKLATRIQTHHVIIGAIGILVLIELCRRCVGVPILCVLGALLIYTFYNQLSYNPSLYQALKNIVYKLFYTTNGVIGTPVERLLHVHCSLHHLRRVPRSAPALANFFIALCQPHRRLGLPAVPQRSRSSRRRSVRHGLGLFRRQHRYHRLGYHPDDEKDRLSPEISRARSKRPPPPAARSCLPSWARRPS